MGFLECNMMFIIVTTSMYSVSFAVVNNCSYSNCTTNMYSSSHGSYYTRWDRDRILFPFRTPDQPQSCGLPGFELGCNDSIGKPLLSFPSGQSYAVESMFNFSRDIEISDPEGCLAEKLMDFNSSGTLFRSKDGFTEFTLYSCPPRVELPHSLLSYMCLEISCDDRGVVVCDTYKSSSGLLQYGCNLLGNVSVAGDWASAYSLKNASSVYLTWDMPSECVQCQSVDSVGECRRDPNNSTGVKCFLPTQPYTYTSPSYKPNKGVTTIVLIVFTLPIVLIGVCACYIRFIQIQSRNRHPLGVPNHAPVNQTHHDVNAIWSPNRGSSARSGLEQATLDTYPIFVVGDSGRILMKMEDKTCPICLSDYEPRDILKSLPECLHKFHSDCIDEWLRAKAMCPVCRTMPSPTS